MPILAKINYDLIDQFRLFVGKKGRYLDLAFDLVFRTWVEPTP